MGFFGKKKQEKPKEKLELRTHPGVLRHYKMTVTLKNESVLVLYIDDYKDKWSTWYFVNGKTVSVEIERIINLDIKAILTRMDYPIQGRNERGELTVIGRENILFISAKELPSEDATYSSVEIVNE